MKSARGFAPIVIILIGIVSVSLVTGGIIYFLLPKTPDPSPATNPSPTLSSSAQSSNIPTSLPSTKPLPTSLPSTKPLPTSSPTNISTTDWKTYTNTKYQFSFKYPSNMQISDYNNFNYDIFFTASQSEKNTLDQCLKEIECYEYRLGVKFEILSKNQKSLSQVAKENLSSDVQFTEKIINNYKVLVNESEGIGLVQNVYIDNGDKVLKMFANAITDARKNMDLFNQILSTFKFTK